MLAPRSSNSSITSRWPPWAARWRGVTPFDLGPHVATFTSIPSSRSRFTYSKERLWEQKTFKWRKQKQLVLEASHNFNMSLKHQEPLPLILLSSNLQYDSEKHELIPLPHPHPPPPHQKKNTKNKSINHKPMPCLNQVKTTFLKWFKWLGSWEIREILTDSM